MLLKPLVTWWSAFVRQRAMIVSPSAERNKAPIGEALAKYMPFKECGTRRGRCVELASGSGQHVSHFARKFPHVDFQPTEYSGGSSGPEAPAYGDLTEVYASMKAHCHDLHNVLAPVELDAAADPWAVGGVWDAVVACNVMHISPWAVTEGIFRGAAKALDGSGRLFVYGPFIVDGKHTSESNEQFDARLKENHPTWGLRDTIDLDKCANTFGLGLEAVIPMPANNQVLVFTTGGTSVSCTDAYY